MSNITEVKQDYERTAASYDGYRFLPLSEIESQLIKIALGDITGLIVLDLGGGSGIHAREAIDAGAKRVDIVDLSPEMMKVAQDAEKALGRDDRIRFYEADVSKSLEHLSLGSYDIVMANWVFDHAGTPEILEGMWQNVAAHLKPGGRFLGVRVADIYAPALQDEKYQYTFKDVTPIPGGLSYRCVINSDPPLDFAATSMETSYSGSFELHEKYGLKGLEIIPLESAETVKNNPEFWELFLKSPPLAVVKGTKQD
ncbi:methyltransferase-like protein [Xylariales sp. PMI_506]|nr:methyltransferase-like protein [Xylariales sp. PMI_506]